MSNLPSENQSDTHQELPSPSPLSNPLIVPTKVIYCNICSFPVEYCEYGTKISKCKKWLSEHHSDLYTRFYPNLEDPIKLESLTIEDRLAIEKSNQDALKKEAKEDAKAKRVHEKVKASKVTVKTIERTKRKRITTIHGLDAFGIDLKKLAKLFANRFATGSSVTKNNQGDDEIVIQGLRSI